MVTEKMIEAAKLFDDMSLEESIGAFGGSGQWVELCTVRDLRKLEAALSTDAEPVAWLWKYKDSENWVGASIEEPNDNQRKSLVIKPAYAGTHTQDLVIEALSDVVDGLQSDIDDAIEVAFRRGAIDWTRDNYPGHYARFMASPAALSAQVQDVATFGPFAHLNGIHGLNEEYWSIEQDPGSNDDELFSIPLYSLVDPFTAAPAAKQEGKP